MARSKVVAGAYSLTWKRTKAVRQLQVVLAPHGSFAESSAPVRVARISACTTQRSSGVRTLTCHTTARRGTKARLLDHGQVLDRARVRKGVVSVRTGGRFRGLVLSVDITRARHIRLHL